MNSESIRPVAVTAAILVSLACASAAQAFVGTTGSGEPPTTKGTSNTWWFGYTPDPDGYQICFTIYKNGTELASYPKNYPTGGHPSGNGNGMCTNAFGGQTQNGTVPFSWNGLEHGSTYQVCASSFYYLDSMWILHFNSYNGCSTTTIDNGKPALTTWVGGEATYTRNPIIPVHLAYQDSLSHPWSRNRGSSGALAATQGCLTRGDSCVPNEIVDGCSQPNTPRYSATPGTKTNSFDCGYDFTSYEDGRVTFCAKQSDWALTDKPSSTDQFAGSSSAQANLSDVACGNVILDRGAPAVDAGGARTVKVGEPVTFNGSASDAVSGVGEIAWTFGDNTAGANGPTVTHTYTQSGTYVAKATATDGAGNDGEGTATITVEPASVPGGETGGETGGGTGGGTGSPTGGSGGAVTSGTSKGGATVQTVTPAEAKTVIVREGGTAAATVDVAGLDVSAPRSLRLSRRGGRLPIVLDAEGPGTVALALVKGASKVVARGGITVTAAGTYVVKLKLGKQTRSGRYSLRVSFTPRGASKATTKKLAVRIAAKKARPRAAAVPAV